MTTETASRTGSEFFANYKRIYFKSDFTGLAVLIFHYIDPQGINYEIKRVILCLFFFKVSTLNRLMHQLEEKMHLTGNSVYIKDLLKLLFQSVILCHVVGTLYYLVAKLEMEYLNEQKTWLQIINYENEIWYKKYAEAFYWAQATIMLVGSKGQTFIETVFCVLTLFATVGMFATILSKISTILDGIDLQTVNYRRDVEILYNFFNDNKDIQVETQSRLLNYIQYLHIGHAEMKANQELGTVLSKFPGELQDIIRYIAEMESFTILTQNFSQSTISALMETQGYMYEEYYMPNEIIFYQNRYDTPKLYLVLKGEVELVKTNQNQQKEVSIASIKAGGYFGENQFFTDGSEFLTAKSREFTTVLVIPRSIFVEIVKQNAEDLEKFAMLEHQVRMKNTSGDFTPQCNICRVGRHYDEKCRLFHYNPNVLNLIIKQNHSLPQERSWQRRKPIHHKRYERRNRYLLQTEIEDEAQIDKGFNSFNAKHHANQNLMHSNFQNSGQMTASPNDAAKAHIFQIEAKKIASNQEIQSDFSTISKQIIKGEEDEEAEEGEENVNDYEDDVNIANQKTINSKKQSQQQQQSRLQQLNMSHSEIQEELEDQEVEQAFFEEYKKCNKEQQKEDQKMALSCNNLNVLNNKQKVQWEQRSNVSITESDFGQIERQKSKELQLERELQDMKVKKLLQAREIDAWQLQEVLELRKQKILDTDDLELKKCIKGIQEHLKQQEELYEMENNEDEDDEDDDLLTESDVYSVVLIDEEDEDLYGGEGNSNSENENNQDNDQMNSSSNKKDQRKQFQSLKNSQALNKGTIKAISTNNVKVITTTAPKNEKPFEKFREKSRLVGKLQVAFKKNRMKEEQKLHHYQQPTFSPPSQENYAFPHQNNFNQNMRSQQYQQQQQNQAGFYCLYPQQFQFGSSKRHQSQQQMYPLQLQPDPIFYQQQQQQQQYQQNNQFVKQNRRVSNMFSPPRSESDSPKNKFDFNLQHNLSCEFSPLFPQGSRSGSKKQTQLVHFNNIQNSANNFVSNQPLYQANRKQTKNNFINNGSNIMSPQQGNNFNLNQFNMNNNNNNNNNQCGVTGAGAGAGAGGGNKRRNSINMVKEKVVFQPGGGYKVIQEEYYHHQLSQNQQQQISFNEQQIFAKEFEFQYNFKYFFPMHNFSYGVYKIKKIQKKNEKIRKKLLKMKQSRQERLIAQVSQQARRKSNNSRGNFNLKKNSNHNNKI